LSGSIGKGSTLLKKTRFQADPNKDKDLLKDLKKYRLALKLKNSIEAEMEKLESNNK
jgi:hypothetical protein